MVQLMHIHETTHTSAPHNLPPHPAIPDSFSPSKTPRKKETILLVLHRRMDRRGEQQRPDAAERRERPVALFDEGRDHCRGGVARDEGGVLVYGARL
jgi:hypothetical protein